LQQQQKFRTLTTR